MKGERALVLPNEKKPGGVLVQFDTAEYDRDGNPSNELCFHWHDFKEDDFTPESESDDVSSQEHQNTVEDFTSDGPQ